MIRIWSFLIFLGYNVLLRLLRTFVTCSMLIQCLIVALSIPFVRLHCRKRNSCLQKISQIYFEYFKMRTLISLKILIISLLKIDKRKLHLHDYYHFKTVHNNFLNSQQHKIQVGEIKYLGVYSSIGQYATPTTSFLS